MTKIDVIRIILTFFRCVKLFDDKPPRECKNRAGGCLGLNVISTEANGVSRKRSEEIPRGSHADNDTAIIFSTVFVGIADGRAVRPRTAA